MKPTDWLRATLSFGPRAAAFRTRWELENRAGLRQVTQPAGLVPVPRNLPDAERFLERIDGQWLGDLRTRAREGDVPAAGEGTRARAVRASHGGFELFGSRTVDFGDPPDFRLEPFTGRRWPDRHWSRVLEAAEAVGDPRATWEMGRALFVYDWIRAWAEDQDPSWPRAFAAHLREFERENPFRTGIHWVSGQELAVRSLSWLTAAAVFSDSDGFGTEDFDRLARLLHWHGHQIVTEQDLARRSVQNNHVLAEALAVAALADLGFLEQRARLPATKVLQRAVRTQFRSDGGYCQQSHRYHRFAIELLLVGERLLPELRATMRPVLARSADYFAHLMVGKGQTTNWGPNDGATAFRWCDADTEDIRPLLALLRARLDERRLPEPGPWDDAVVWMYGRVPDQVTPAVDRHATFGASGLHVLRGDRGAVILRTGPTNLRGGHADLLHVDVWWKGEAVTLDPGTASYHDEVAHRWYGGSAAHCTVTLGGSDQLDRVARFTWLDDPPTTLEVFDGDRGTMSAATEAWRKEGVLHRREVTLVGDGTEVIDELTRMSVETDLQRFRLHWLVPGRRVRLETSRDCFTWNIRTRNATFTIRVLEATGTIRHASARVEETHHAPHYGTVEPATSIVVEADALDLRFVTRIECR